MAEGTARFCSAAGCITAKEGPFSDLICTACAGACKRCGDACEKHGANDPLMKQCMAAAVVAVAASYWLPGKWYILLGGLAGSLVGAFRRGD